MRRSLRTKIEARQRKSTIERGYHHIAESPCLALCGDVDPSRPRDPQTTRPRSLKGSNQLEGILCLLVQINICLDTQTTATMVVKAAGRVICLFSQQLPHRSTELARRRQGRILHIERRPAIKEDMLATVYNIPSLEQLKMSEGNGPALPPDLAQDQLDLHSPVDLLREVLLQNMAPALRHDHIRYPVQQVLSTPHHTATVPFQRPSFPLSGDPLPHPVFRDALTSRPGVKEARRIIREQLLRCQYPRDILRVMAVAMQRKETAREMSRMHESLRRALYRIRNNVTDEAVLRTINVIIMRLQKANLPVAVELSKLGVKFAARARSLPGMKRYLKEFKLSGGYMTGGVFRSIIAKFSIGARGLGEIRNGRWRRKELLVVLLGFDDTPPEEAHHLEVFLVRDDWQFFHGWLAVLARCKAVDQLWKEWDYWFECPARKNPRKLQITDKNTNTRVRGDHWFVEQMAYSGDLKKAWEVLEISGIPFANVRPSVRAMLLEGAECATTSDEEIQKGLLLKYDTELKKIEGALGVTWVSGKSGCGYHLPQSSTEDTLEALADPSFVLEPDHGFPWEEPTVEGK